jgi:UDP-N-acetylmuramoyl-L-alanyl-D-glutamate--2,6-diaminopimelate ligase
MTEEHPRSGARVSSGAVTRLPPAHPHPAFPPVSLARLTAALADPKIRGDETILVTDVAFDSREVTPGAVFFCVPGSRVDGHSFAPSAIDRGAAALVVERWLEPGIPQILVPSVRATMGPMSAAAFADPASSMKTVGVTGTNGKTTITYLLGSIFAAANWTPGVVGTTGASIAGAPVPLARTTPEAPDLQRLLAQMRDRDVRAAAMEVSSHALEQRRVDGFVFDVAIFTNLSQDHLDFHPSMEAYFEAKARLFDSSHARVGAVNVGDAFGRRLVEVGIPVTTYAVEERADLEATDVTVTRDGIAFSAGRLAIRSALRGAFNVENVLASVAGARLLGIEDAAIADGIAALDRVPGRMEPVEAGQRFLTVVDYAHTPDSIRSVLRAARPLTSGRLILVFGCGGDRDRAKRPLMGAAATANADLAVITTDNPRSEDPLAIIREIEIGARREGGAFISEPDRRQAIRLALHEAAAGDVVIIAGRGHEPFQEWRDTRVPFDDRLVVREELEALGSGT